MRKNLKKRRNGFIATVVAILVISIVVLAHNPIPYSIDWSNTQLITEDNTWNLNDDLGIIGYSGADISVAPGTDARTITTESSIIDVQANQNNPNAPLEGGVAEFEIANPTIAIKGSDAASVPYSRSRRSTV